MAGSSDPRFDRVIAALNTLEAVQRSQSEALDALKVELAAAHRDAAQAREDAAFAKAETAAYQAELAATARRSDLERFAERLDATDGALAEVRRGDLQAASVRDQVVKLSRALQKAASVGDLAEVTQRMEQIDDRLQVRMDHLADDVGATSAARVEMQSLVAQVSGDAGDVGQELDQRVQAVEAEQRQLAERFDRVVVTAEAEIERVAGHLEKRIIELTERLDLQGAALGGVPDPEPALELLNREIGDLDRGLRGLRSTLESDRTEVRKLDQRVFGPDGVSSRLMQLAEIVVDRNGLEPELTSPTTDRVLLEFQGRVEELVSKVEGLSTLRSRVELIEDRLDLS